MTRTLAVAAAQLGPVARSETRDQVVTRLLALLREAAGRGCRLVVFPELTLTTFFPRWLIEDETEIHADRVLQEAVQSFNIGDPKVTHWIAPRQ